MVIKICQLKCFIIQNKYRLHGIDFFYYKIVSFLKVGYFFVYPQELTYSALYKIGFQGISNEWMNKLLCKETSKW